LFSEVHAVQFYGQALQTLFPSLYCPKEQTVAFMHFLAVEFRIVYEGQIHLKLVRENDVKHLEQLDAEMQFEHPIGQRIITLFPLL